MTNCNIPKPTEEQVARAERLLSCGVLVADMAQLLANHEAETKRLRELSECCSCPTDTLNGPNHAMICRACAKEMVAEHDAEIERLREGAIILTRSARHANSRVEIMEIEYDKLVTENARLRTIERSEEYPNLEAIAQGCIAGDFREWPKVQPEAKAMLEEIKRLKEDLFDRVMGAKKSGYEEGKVAAMQQIAVQDAEGLRLLTVLASIAVAFQPVLEWYEGDGDRELFEMIADAVADLQTDRAEKLQLRKERAALQSRNDAQAESIGVFQRSAARRDTQLLKSEKEIKWMQERLAAASKPVVSDSKEDLTMGRVVDRLNEQHTKIKQLQHKILDLHTEIASLHRAVRASVPTSYKTCGGGLGAVQSYIADLEREIVLLQAELRVAKGLIERLHRYIADLENENKRMGKGADEAAKGGT